MARIALKSAAAGILTAGAAAAALAIGAAGAQTPDEDATLTRLEAADYAAHAGKLFQRADIDKNGVLDAREYHALAIVTAELSRLNRAVMVDVEDSPQMITLDYDGPASLSQGERARIDAVSARAFFNAAGADNLMSADEFVALELERFADADRNDNGVLTRSELTRLAARNAHLAKSQV